MNEYATKENKRRAPNTLPLLLRTMYKPQYVIAQQNSPSDQTKRPGPCRTHPFAQTTRETASALGKKKNVPERSVKKTWRMAGYPTRCLSCGEESPFFCGGASSSLYECSQDPYLCACVSPDTLALLRISKRLIPSPASDPRASRHRADSELGFFAANQRGPRRPAKPASGLGPPVCPSRECIRRKGKMAPGSRAIIANP